LKPRYVLLTLMYCAGLFWLSSGANPIHVKPVFPGEDKIVHACLYAGLACVVSMGLRRSGRTYAPWVLFLAPILFAALYGVTDEFHQRFVPGRTCDVWDLTADACGAIIVQIAIYYIGPVVSRDRTR
jgi:VanZ family protein